jgi:hypothetical protein
MRDPPCYMRQELFAETMKELQHNEYKKRTSLAVNNWKEMYSDRMQSRVN